MGLEETKRKYQPGLPGESMRRSEAKSLRHPEQVRRFPNGRVETVTHRETTIGRFLLEPGWRWSRDVGPIAQTHSCQIHHLGVVLKGRLRIETQLLECGPRLRQRAARKSRDRDLRGGDRRGAGRGACRGGSRRAQGRKRSSWRHRRLRLRLSRIFERGTGICAKRYRPTKMAG